MNNKNITIITIIIIIIIIVQELYRIKRERERGMWEKGKKPVNTKME